MTEEPELLIQDFRKAGYRYAKMKAAYEAAEHYRKVLIAILMSRSSETSIAAQEREALKDEQHQQHLAKLRSCVEKAEEAKTDLRAAEFAIEVWRTRQANERMERKSYAA